MRWVLSYAISGLLHVTLWAVCLISARVVFLPQSRLSSGETLVTELTWAAADSEPVTEVAVQVEIFPEPAEPESEPETPAPKVELAATPTAVRKQKADFVKNLDASQPTPLLAEIAAEADETLAQTLAQTPAKQAEKTPDTTHPQTAQVHPAAPASVATPYMRPTVVGALSTAPPRSLPDNLPPAYPSDALRANIEGQVLIRANVSFAGEVVFAEIENSSGSTSLDVAALTAIKQWQFVPAQLLGVAVSTDVRIPIRFSIKRS